MKKNFCLNSCNNNLSKRWYISYSDTNKAGRVVTKKIYEGINRGKTVKERTDIANKILQRLNNEGITENKTAKTVLQNHIETSFWAAVEVVRPTIRKKTFQAYQSKTRIFLAWCKANKIVYFNDLTADIIRQFFNKMLDDGRSNATYCG